MFKKNDIKSLEKRILDLQDLRKYFYAEYKRKKLDVKIRELQKELILIKR